MKHRMKLVQVIEKYFEFEAPLAADNEQRLILAWHALDEDNVVFTESVKRERIEVDRD